MHPIQNGLLSARQRAKKGSFALTTPIRRYAPDSISMGTRRTTQGEFLAKPEPEVTQAELYLLGYNQEKYDIGIHSFCDVLNHLHGMYTDYHGDRLGLFLQNFHSLLAKFINHNLGRFQNVWDNGKTNIVQIPPRAEDVVRYMGYIGNNVTEAGLVENPKDWPGVSLVATSATEQTYTIVRPKEFFSSKGSLPETVTLRITLPKVTDATPDELGEMIQDELARRAKESAEKLKSQGREFMGVEKIMAIDPFSKPKKELEHFKLIPTVACKNSALRIKYLRWLKRHRKRYRAIRQQLMQGVKNLIFPEGALAVYLQFGQAREDWQGCIWARLAADWW